MSAEEQLVTDVQLQVSGKEIYRRGVHAFVFIYLDSWNDDTSQSLSDDVRNRLFKSIFSNVWKSFTAGNHQVSGITKCMHFTKKSNAWKPAVDHRIDFSSSGNLETWARLILPRTKPIVVAAVADHSLNWKPILKTIHPCNILAYHRLAYRLITEPYLFQMAFEGDPEGTIEIRRASTETASTDQTS